MALSSRRLSLTLQNNSSKEKNATSFTNNTSFNENGLSFKANVDLIMLNALNQIDEINPTLKRHREKCNILKEILSSENKYTNDLKEIVNGYYDEILKSHKDNEEFVYHIFSNIKEIYEFSLLFYSMLEAANNNEIEIASCFIKKHKTFSKLYSIYCQNYKIAFSTTERLEKDLVIGKIIQKVRIKYGHSLKMATYLQLPVLRITKYHLLLQRYLKLLDKDSMAYDQVFEALELMRQVNDQINQDMPEISSAKTENCSSHHFNTQKLVSLFGPILKQGNLVLVETKNTHHVIVFQTMFLIKKTDSLSSKIIRTISNEYLGFSPKSLIDPKNVDKCFTIIDYGFSKGENQLLFKAKSFEEKQTWQSAILSCMLNGYGKKISENVRKKVLKLDPTSEKLSTPQKQKTDLKTKFSNFKRLRDFRYSLKSEFKNASNQELNLRIKEEQEEKIQVKKEIVQDNSILSNERRLSEPFQSSIIRLFENNNPSSPITDVQKKSDNMNSTLTPYISNISSSSNNYPDSFKNLFKKFRKEKAKSEGEKIFSDFQVQCSMPEETFITLEEHEKNESESDDTANDLKNESSIEIKLNNFEIIYQQLSNDHSMLDISANPLNDSTLINFEKFINKNIAYSVKNLDENNLYGTNGLFNLNTNASKNSTENNLNTSLETYDNEMTVDNNQEEVLNFSNEIGCCEALSSKSSINSEEGYYSNHENSSTSTLVNEKPEEIKILLKPFKLNLCKSKQSRYSTPELAANRKLNNQYEKNNLTDFIDTLTNSTDSESHDPEKFERVLKNGNHIECITNKHDENVYQDYFESMHDLKISLNELKESEPKLIDNVIVLRSKQFELNHMNKIQKTKFRKNPYIKEAVLNRSLVNNAKSDNESNPDLKSLNLYLKLDKPYLNYNKFSRNMNSSLADLNSDNNQHFVNKESNDSNKKNENLDESNPISKIKLMKMKFQGAPKSPIIKQKETIRSAKFKNASSLTSLNNDYFSTNFKQEKYGSDCLSSENNNLDTTEFKINVKDLISKFEMKTK